MTSASYKQILLSHGALLLLICFLPFSGTELVSTNLLGITGMKPLNLLGLLVLLMWLVKGGQIVVYSNEVKATASILYFLYLVIFILSFYRSSLSLDLLVVRDPPDFASFEGNSVRYVLSHMVVPLLSSVSFIYIINHVKTRETVGMVMDIYLLTFFVFAIGILMVSISFIFNGGERKELQEALSGSFGFHYNNLATFLMLALVPALSQAQSKGRFWIIVFFAILLALISCQSRGAMLGGLIGIMCFFYLQRSINLSTALMFLVIGGVGMWFLEPLIGLLSIGVESGSLGEISSGRVDAIWLPLFAELADNGKAMMLGYGLYGMVLSESFVTVPYFVHANHAHSAYVDLLINGGLVVFVPFMLLIAFYVKKAFSFSLKIKEGLYNGLLSAVPAYLVSCVFGRQFLPSPEIMMLLPLIALMLVYAINWDVFYPNEY